MRRAAYFALLALAITSGAARAADVPIEANLSWVLPTQTVGGQPLTGPLALTGVNVFVSQAPIADAAILLPAAKLPPTATAYTYRGDVPNGATLYFRVQAENMGGASAYSPTVTRAVKVDVPGAPTGTKVTVTVVVSATP